MSGSRWQRAARALLVATLLQACAGSQPSPQPVQPSGRQVSHSVLSRSGPFTLSPAVAAALGLAELRSQAAGLGDGCQPGAQLPGQCWPDATAPAGSLLVALSADLPCWRTKSMRATLTGGSLLVFEVAGEASCAPGAGTAPRIPLWLLAVPFAELPSSGTLRVEVRHPGRPDGSASATVDLSAPH